MQRTSIPDHVIPILMFLDGILSITFAIFAHLLGFDSTPNMGMSRIVMLWFGLILVLGAVILLRVQSKIRAGEKIKTIFLTGHVWAVIIFIYVFFITFGNFTTWKASTRYYTLLADAFSKGQLHVNVEPGAALLSADDPYSSEGRPGFNDDVWDLSLYDQKLYLYWGPVPALALTPIQFILQRPIADIYLVFFFLCGLLIVNSLFILKMWRLFFADIPFKNIVISIILIGLILPILWSLNIPDVYEAAIGSGQFFIIGGIFFVLLSFEEPIRRRYLFLSGLFWACSVGSRAINVFSVLFLTAMTLFWLWKEATHNTSKKDLIRAVISLLMPLTIGAILIGWYNWARFDHPFEFGLRYQITIYNLNRDMPLTFQVGYLPFNIIAYLFLPFEFIARFPFIQPIEFSRMLNDHGITTPHLYAAGRVVGFLFYSPILLLSFLPFTKQKQSDLKLSGNYQTHTLMIYLLGGSFLISLITLLFYFYGQMRFIVDLISQITLLAIFGYWWVIRNSKGSKVFLHISNTLILLTLISSLLLAFTSEASRMDKHNPELMDKLNSFFIQK